jgi:hypothetical protein
MKNLFLFFLLLIISLFLFQCKSPTNDNGNNLVSFWAKGYVKDSLTQNAISGAKISQWVKVDSTWSRQDTVQSDSTGFYFLFLYTGCDPLGFIRAEKTGYVSKDSSCWTINSLARSGDTIKLDFMLNRVVK